MEFVDDVLSANEAFYDAFGTADMQAMSAVWASKAPVTCIHPGWNPVSGRKEVLSSWKGIIDSPSRPTIECVQSTADIYGDTAVIYCYETLHGGYLLATNIFVMEDGAWRMVHHHAGGPVAPPEKRPNTQTD